MDELILLSEKMTSLLKEYKESKIYESCTYHVIKDQNCFPVNRYFLYRIEDKKQILYSNKEKIISWLSIRKIETNTVYNYEILL